MTTKFKQDCFQHNPHMNYLKITPLLKQAIATLNADIESFCKDTFSIVHAKELENLDVQCHFEQMYDAEARKQFRLLFVEKDFQTKLINIANTIATLLTSLDSLEKTCLIYVEAHFVEKFLKENLLNPKHYNSLIKISFICSLYIWESLMNRSTANIDDIKVNGHANGNKIDFNLSQIIDLIQSINVVYKNKSIGAELHSQFEIYQMNFELLLNVVFELTIQFLVNNVFQLKYDPNKIPEQCLGQFKDHKLAPAFSKVIFLSKFIECICPNYIGRIEKSDGVTYEPIETYLTSKTFNLIGLKVSIYSKFNFLEKFEKKNIISILKI